MDEQSPLLKETGFYEWLKARPRDDNYNAYSWATWFRVLDLGQLRALRETWFRAIQCSDGHEKKVMVWDMTQLNREILLREGADLGDKPVSV